MCTLIGMGGTHLHGLVHDMDAPPVVMCSARTYGDQAIECGDVFYYYGDALLQLASTEQTLIGGGAELGAWRHVGMDGQATCGGGREG
jgi:hypothetical protein